ncbi:flagellar motor protein MotB [Ahrensia sp. R2A130]|uniref:flagellar motor protein MotB n=1 Tax=Ahrensia sp. R2A130 TaxID=744979 RepID=UPI0001E083BC|nr:flagellar motor protein MotB [Ahrensia sp. R2A130]EFL89487.1 chemotaxis protein MotB [Ahrensia sp. R2A130]
MNTADNEQPIIIVRRNRIAEDGHHGGAWKIAFADFMTAMMALFLVLWLINAANEETKKSVASYFNPVKLVDRNRSKKGIWKSAGPSIETGEETEAGTDTQPEDKDSTSGPASSGAGADGSKREAEFIADPFSELEEIASAERENMAAKTAAVGMAGDEESDAIRDPFSPVYWKPEPETPTDEITPIRAEEEKPQPEITSEVSADDEAAREETDDAGASDVLKELKAAVAKAVDDGPRLDVTPTPDGLLISITDDFDFAMFETGSSVPSGRLVLAMDAVAQVLSERPGKLHIHGHTDARPFRGGERDNWTLSSARAHSARYMLLRGGFGEKRIVEISGFADRRLKLVDEPDAASNRRIELLLEPV